MAHLLSESARAELDELGFTVIPQLFSPDDMNALAERIEPFHRDANEHTRKEHRDSNISRADQITFSAFLAEHDATIRDFCLRAEFVAISTQILGPDVDLYWNQSVFKYPEVKQEFPWHQDDGYAAVSPSPYLTCWVALTDATLENGCISVLPRVHSKGLLPHRQSPLGLVCHDADHPDQGRPVPVRQGSVIVFYSLTPHKSGCNLSSEPRKAYVIQYSKAGLFNVATGEAIPDRISVARRGRAAA